MISNLATGFALKYYEDSILSCILSVTVINDWFILKELKKIIVKFLIYIYTGGQK
jgi:hypothetical protein